MRAALGPQQVDQITAQLPARSWNRRSAGDGSKGWRDYDRARVALVPPETEQRVHACRMLALC